MTNPGQTFRFRPSIRRALLDHGIAPTDGSNPERVYELLKSIYTFEIRRARALHAEAVAALGPQPLERLREEVRRLGLRYAVLKVPAHHWVEQVASDPPHAPPAPRPRRSRKIP